MNGSSITTGSSLTTITVSWPCEGASFGDPTEACDWAEMHHYDDDGNHWCPTGFMYCHTHGGIGTIDGPGACQLWGTKPDA